MKIMVTSLKRSQACTTTVCAPVLQQATTDPCLCQRLPDTPQVCLLWGQSSFLLGPGAKVLLCPPRIYFTVLSKFWKLHGGLNGDLLQEDLCHVHTQSPCPYSTSKTARLFLYSVIFSTIFRAFSLNKIVCGCLCG